MLERLQNPKLQFLFEVNHSNPVQTTWERFDSADEAERKPNSYRFKLLMVCQKSRRKRFLKIEKVFFSLSSGKRMEEKNNCSWSNFFLFVERLSKDFKDQKKGFSQQRRWEERETVSFQTIFGKRVITSSRESHQSHLLQPLDELQWIQWDKDYN